MAKRSLARTANSEQSSVAKELTLTCPFLYAGILASSQTVQTIYALCLHEECQWWSVPSSNCIVHDFPGILAQLTETASFMLPARKETRGGKER